MESTDKPIIFVLPGHFKFLKILAIVALVIFSAIIIHSLGQQENQQILSNPNNIKGIIGGIIFLFALSAGALLYVHRSRISVTLTQNEISLFWEATKKSRTINYTDILKVKSSANTGKIILSLKHGMPVHLPGYLIPKEDTAFNQTLKSAIEERITNSK